MTAYVVPIFYPYRAVCPVCEADSGMVVAADVEGAGERLEEMGWGRAKVPGHAITFYCPGCWPVVSGEGGK